MKKLAILMLLALEFAVSGCGTSSPSTVTNTSATGSWESQLIGGIGEASKLNFVTEFTVENSGPLDVTGFSFINSSACFANGLNGSTEAGTASFTTTTGTGEVTGQLTFTITSVTPPGNVLTLTSPEGGLTGTSNGTTTTTGTLSGGVAVGSWTLTGGAGDPSCAVLHGTFTMCQATATCTVP